MNVQWPREFELAARAEQSVDLWNAQRFEDLIASVTSQVAESLERIAARVLDSDPIDKLQEDILDVSIRGRMPQDEDTQAMLLCLACCNALEKRPLIETWEKVQSVAYNSWHVENLLTYALEARSQCNEATKEAFLKLAREVFHRDDISPARSTSSRRSSTRMAVEEYWPRVNNKLEDLLGGLRWSDPFTYRDNLALLRLLAVYSESEFVSLMGQAKNPNLVQSALLVSGASSFSPHFEGWVALTEKAPVAFTETGQWNGSLLLPLLLYVARSELLQASDAIRRLNNGMRADADIPSVERFPKEVVTVLSRRVDARQLFMRWSAWLVRQLLDSVEAKRLEVGTSEFMDCKLLEAISEHVRGPVPDLVALSDTGDWESWSLQGALNFHASNGAFDAPVPRRFLDEWNIGPEDWVGVRGQNLRAHANSFTLKRQEIPGFDAHLLAYSIARTSDGPAAWMAAWEKAQSLREIVEFGDFDGGNDVYSGRYDASRLLMLLFRIGLAVLDQKIGDPAVTVGNEAYTLAEYHTALVNAATEMVEVNDTIDRPQWEILVLHLIVRRFLWEKPSGGGAADDRGIFSTLDEPNAASYLRDARGNIPNLLRIVATLLENNVDEQRVLGALDEASVDLPAAIDVQRRLNKIDSRRYPFDEHQMQRLQKLARRGR